VFGSAALALLGLSLIVRLGEHLVSRVAVTVPTFSKARRRKAALITATSLFVAACGGGTHSANQALTNAQKAGAPSQAVVGESLDEARLAQQAKRPHACIADYTKALKAFPRLVSAYAGRAACYGSVDAAASVHDLDRALALSPGDPALLLQRAVADRRSGDLGAAQQDYRSAANSPAATAAEMLQAVDGLIALDQIDLASQVLRSAMERFPSSPLMQLAAYNLAIANGNQEAAGVALDQAGKDAVTTSDVVSVLSRRCGYQLTLQEYQAAVATCERAASLSSDASGAYDNLAAALAQQGQLQQAIVAVTSSIGSFQGSVGPNAQPAGVDGFGLAHLYEARGRLYVETHQIPLALADYQQALKAVPPKSPDFVARLKGDTAAAKRDV
jgi:tetratricopeptide (TPR) repeat protein